MATSLEVNGWREELGGLLARFGRLFVRSEPREQAGRYLEGLLGLVERTNGWQLAEAIGDAPPVVGNRRHGGCAGRSQPDALPRSCGRCREEPGP